MISALQSALSGLNAASTRVEAAAANIAGSGTPQGDSVSLSDEAIDLMTARTAYKASAITIRAAQSMQDDLLKSFDRKV